MTTINQFGTIGSMRRSRITITLKQQLVEDLDRLVDGEKIRNRSHAIEYIVDRFFQPIIKKAVIMAGGRGTEISTAVIESLIVNLKKSHITDIVICIGYDGEKIRRYFSNGDKFSVKINYSSEKKPLLTGGALLKAKNFLNNEPFLVIYGDVMTNLPFIDIVNFHEQQKALATIALTTVEKPEEFGQLKLHGSTLVNFYQKNKTQPVKSNLINCGIYVFQPEIFDYFPDSDKPFFLEDVIEQLTQKKKVNGFVFEEKWIDVGKT